MRKLERDVVEHGGIASIRELLALKHRPEEIDMALRYRSLLRVRNGWVAIPDVPESVLMAWRIGGSLACSSAVEFHLRFDVVEPLHVLVPANATGMRRPHDHRSRLVVGDAVVHWATTPRGGRDFVVSLGAALQQVARCRGLPAAQEHGERRPATSTL